MNVCICMLFVLVIFVVVFVFSVFILGCGGEEFEILEVMNIFNMFESDGKEVVVIWYMNYDDVMKEVKEIDWFVLVLFIGSDWCIWCKCFEGEVFVK